MPNAIACEYSREIPPTASVDAFGRTSYTLGYDIATDGNMAPGAVANDCLSTFWNPSSANPGPQTLPFTGEPYSYAGFTDNYAYLLNRSVAPKEFGINKVIWLVTDEYGPAPEGQLGDYTTAPVSRETVYSWDREVYAETLEMDIYGAAVINTAGQPYDEPIEIERTRSVLVAEYNVATLAAAIVLSAKFEGAVNATAWAPGGGTATVNPRQALCREVTSSRLQTENGATYYRLAVRVAIHEQQGGSPYPQAGTWDIGILQRGFSAYPTFTADPDPKLGYIKTDGSVEGDSLDTEAERSSEPWLLNENGKVLPTGEAPVYKWVRARREVEFNGASGIGF